MEPPAPSQASRPSPRADARSPPRLSQPTAAKSSAKKAKRPRRQEEEADTAEQGNGAEGGQGHPAEGAESIKEEADASEVVGVEEATYTKLKTRRTMPGAATSETDFANLFRNLSMGNDIFQMEPPEEVDTSDTIIHKVKLWRGLVSEHLPANCPDYIVRLGVGVLAFGRARQADIFLREHALVYWISEGGRTLRFHAGDCYMKGPSGAFQQHRGVPPDHDRVQNFLLHLEGIFRRIPTTTSRTANDLLDAVKNLYAAAEGQDTFLTHCVDACLNVDGDAARGRGGGNFPEDGPALGGWTAATAKTILAVKKQLSYELTQDKLLHYMCEWCEAAKVIEAACCYEDCCVKYDVDSVPAKQVLRESLENCYLRVPHSLKGTVPLAVVERVQKFYAQTFWGNIAVFKCGQAAQALAKRGLNVVRLFIGLSSGGVGQSLYSTHLQAMYTHNFAFFDPNIWFQEEEMRKQVEQLNGCIILTGQETPGTRSALVDGNVLTVCFMPELCSPKSVFPCQG